jgi:hypothetical protein
MAWVLWTVGGLVGAIAVAAVVMIVIGMMLPKAHVASRMIHLNQPAETVWATVTDFANWTDWNTRITSMVRMDDQDGCEVWNMKSSFGDMPSAIVERVAPSRLVTKIADPKLPFGGTWTWRIEPDADGCTVRITEDGEIYNPFFRFMSRYIFGYDGTMKGFLLALGQKYGEDVSPV